MTRRLLATAVLAVALTGCSLVHHGDLSPRAPHPTTTTGEVQTQVCPPLCGDDR